jgi:deoxyadenosine/deoxycytidine kinase
MTDKCGTNFTYDNAYDSDYETDDDSKQKRNKFNIVKVLSYYLKKIFNLILAIIYITLGILLSLYNKFKNKYINKQYKPVIISIEGNIGSGKSTLVKHLRKVNVDWIFLDEPVTEWEKVKNDKGESLLQLFYKDMPRWSYTFQNYAYITRMRKLIDITKKKYNKQTYIITERSVYTDRHVFAEMLLKDGKMTQMEMNMYLNWFNLLHEFATIDHVVYLRTDSKKCLERINKRSRVGESNITIDYLLSLELQHDKWINNHEKSLFLDGNTDLNTDEPDQFIKFDSQIKKYLNNI